MLKLLAQCRRAYALNPGRTSVLFLSPCFLLLFCMAFIRIAGWEEVLLIIALFSADVLIIRLYVIAELAKETQRVIDVAKAVAGVGIWHLDYQNNILQWDRNMCMLHGVDAEEMKGTLEMWRSFVHVDDLAAAEEALAAAAMAGTKSFVSEFRVVRRDNGEFNYIKAIANIFYDSAGRVNNVIGTNWDITEQKQQQCDLQEAIDTYRDIFESSALPILLINPATGMINNANSAALKFYGYSKDELLGMEIWHINILPKQKVMDAILQIEKGVHSYFNFRHRLKDGEIKDVDVFSGIVNIQGKTQILSYIIDVTARKILEEINELTQKNFDTFFNTIDEMLFVVDTGGDIVYMNESVCKKLGYEQGELLGASVLNVHPQERCDEVMETVRAMLAGTKDFCLIPMKRKDGSHIAVETRAVNGEWNGQPVIFGVTKDISDLKLSEAKFAAAFHAGAVMMAISSIEDGIYIDVNEQFLRTLGFEREEVVGKKSTEVLGFSYERERLKEKFARDGVLRNEEVVIHTKHGEPRYGLFSAEAVQLDDTAFWVTAMVDITVRKAMERSIKDNEERMQLATSGSMVGMWDWYVQEGRVVFNEEWAQMIGYSLEELQPASIETWIKYVHPEDLKRSSELLKEHFEGKAAHYECEARLRHKNGAWVWVLDRGKVVEWDAEGKPIRMLGAHIDINERKKVEMELEVAKIKAESANVAKEHFLSTMSHEMRNPLNGILGMLALLKETELSEEQKEYLKDAKDAGSILLVLINDILDFSKIEAGKLLVENEVFDIREAVAETARIVLPKVKEKGLLLHTIVDNAVPGLVKGDVVRVKQILNNLLSNAVKFTVTGKIAVHVEKERSTESATLVKFTVLDSGIGIAEEAKKRLFRPFEQESVKTSRHFGGTGLGLAISKQLVNMMGGEISCVSEKNEGTVFTFTIKFENVDASADLTAKEKVLESKSVATVVADDKQAEKSIAIKILVAEDDVINRKIIKNRLQKNGYVCDEAINGQVALEKYIEHKGDYDLIFMDGHMPVLDGYEATTLIREYEKHSQSKSRTYIVAMTANAMKGDKERGLSVGMDAYMTKPIDFAKVMNVVDEVRKKNN